MVAERDKHFTAIKPTAKAAIMTRRETTLRFPVEPKNFTFGSCRRKFELGILYTKLGLGQNSWHWNMAMKMSLRFRGYLAWL